MENQIKEYLQNHIQDMRIRMEAASHNTYDKGYAEGSLDLAVKLTKEIEQIHIPIIGISDEKFEEYLEEFIDENSVEEALKMSGLLPPFTSSIQNEPKINNSDKIKFKGNHWLSEFENKLDEMYLLHDMEENDFRKLLALTNEEFQMDNGAQDYDLENFIEQAILKINPDKYGIYQPGAVVRVKHDLIVGSKYNGSEYTEDMNKIKDRVAIITGKNATHDTFTLDIDKGDNEWTNDMVKLLQNP